MKDPKDWLILFLTAMVVFVTLSLAGTTCSKKPPEPTAYAGQVVYTGYDYVLLTRDFYGEFKITEDRPVIGKKCRVYFKPDDDSEVQWPVREGFILSDHPELLPECPTQNWLSLSQPAIVMPSPTYTPTPLVAGSRRVP